MKKIIFFLIIPILNFAQNVGINTNSPENSAVLDIFATDKGFLAPRVSLTNVTNTTTPINSPSTGLFIWNTNATVTGGFGVGFYYFNGTQWVKFQEPNDLDAAYDTGGAGAGRIIVADAGAVKITGTDGILVTGTFGSGDIIDDEITGAGTRMYFNPNNSAFRAGTISDNSWNNAQVQNYTTAFGLNNRSKSGRTFTANYNNAAETNGINGGAFGTSNRATANASYAFGNTTLSKGNNSISFGTLTEANGYDSFTYGEGTIAPTQSEIAFGTYPKNYAKFNNSGAVFSDSDSQFYSDDRLFVLGNGTSTTTRHNVIDIQKDRTIIINEAYTLPITDGTANQIITTDGTGILSWTTPQKSITQISLYADNNVLTYTGGANADIGNCVAGFIPSIFGAGGNVKIKALIYYTTRSGAATMRIMDQNNNILIGAGSFTNTNIGTGGVMESAWVNFNGGASVYNLKLNGSIGGGTPSITIKNVIILVQSQ